MCIYFFRKFIYCVFYRTIDPDYVLDLKCPTRDFLCPLSANTFGIDFLSFTIGITVFFLFFFFLNSSIHNNIFIQRIMTQSTWYSKCLETVHQRWNFRTSIRWTRILCERSSMTPTTWEIFHICLFNSPFFLQSDINSQRTFFDYQQSKHPLCFP